MRVTLSPPVEADIPAIAAVMQVREVSRWLASVPWPYGLTDAEAFVRTAGSQDLAIRVDGAFAGMVRCDEELGYWLAPEWQGRGIATRAAELALSRHFAGGTEVCHARVFVGNERSRKLLARLGFRAVARTLAPSVSLGPVPAVVLRVTAERFAAARESGGWR